MSFNRRNFLKNSMMGAAAVAASQVALSSCCNAQKCDTEKKEAGIVPLNLSFQESILGDMPLNEKLDYMEQLGVVGLEVGGNGLAGRVQELQDALKGRKIKISAICSGFQGFMLSTDPKIYDQFVTTYKEIIAAAGQLGSVGVIMVPGFNNQVPARPHTLETRAWLVERLREYGEFAAQNNTTIILEPLNRGEAFYLRQVGDAASICRDTNSKGVTCMGDFWHMTIEENCDYGAFFSASGHLSHVHMASRGTRSFPGVDGDKDCYINGFKALQQMKYPNYVSFECGWGYKDDRKVAAANAVKLLNEQWEKAAQIASCCCHQA